MNINKNEPVAAQFRRTFLTMIFEHKKLSTIEEKQVLSKSILGYNDGELSCCFATHIKNVDVDLHERVMMECDDSQWINWYHIRKQADNNEEISL